MQLDQTFLDQYRDRKPPMDDLGLVTFLRTYSTHGRESWFDVCKRVVEGAWTIGERGFDVRGMNPDHMQTWGQRMFDHMFNMRWVPAGRGLQHMGHDRMWRKGSAVFQSCAYVDSSNDAWISFLANMSMLGVGVGFDTSGAGKHMLRTPAITGTCVVSDTREGWVDVFATLYAAMIGERADVPAYFDLSALRPKGAPLVTMGGVSSGPGPLGEAIVKFCKASDVLSAFYDAEEQLVSVYAGPAARTDLTPLRILDFGNIVGVCVVSGGIRRSAEIAIFDERDESVFHAKRDTEKLYAWRWASNNTVRLTEPPTRDFVRKVVQNCHDFGDPGLLFLYNVLGKGRTGDVNLRERGHGCNPCVTGDTVVNTLDGPRKVQELVDTPFAFWWNGQIWHSDGFWLTKSTRKLVEVWFTDGTHIKCTPDHKFITTRGPVAASKLFSCNTHPLSFRFGADQVIAQGDGTKTVAAVVRVKMRQAVDVYDCSVPGINMFPANGAMIANCGEQPLESMELCNLVEICLPRCENYAQFEQVALCALYYGKLVTMLPVGYEDADRIMHRNRRIGVSVTGFVECADRVTPWLTDAYSTMRKFDQRISRLHNVPESVKITSVKPSGTVSIVLGCSPGMNPHFAPYYVRRINIEDTSPLVDMLKAAGYPCERNKYSKSSYVFEFPMRATGPTGLSAIDQLKNVLTLQANWSDNMVSNTIVFDEHEIDDIADFVFAHSDKFKSLAFLRREHGFEQAPLEEISAEDYAARVAALRPLDLSILHGADVHDTDEAGCESGKCEISFGGA